MFTEEHISAALDGTLAKFSDFGEVKVQKVPRDFIPTHVDRRFNNSHAVIDDGMEKAAKPKPFRRPLEESERRQITALRKEGVPVRTIARRIGRCPGTVGVWISRLPKCTPSPEPTP
jgi:DNA-binding NarL/FixJ family response regulator